MKLLMAPQSPFVRKVSVVAVETGLDHQIEPEAVAMIPGNKGNAYTKDLIPLQKIPALILGDGRVLFDSGVICEYLTGISGRDDLLPEDVSERAQVMTLQALADGISDAAVSLRYETWLRPRSYRWQKWQDAQRAKIRAGIAWAELNPGCLSGPLNLGQIALACSLGYICFRWPDAGWLEGAHQLSAWYEEIENRPAFRATRPADSA